MSEPMLLVGGALLAALVGFALGALFFVGLRWTVQHALGSRAPAAWFLGSHVVRTAGVLAGFFLVAGDRWERWLACLVGFVVARRVVTKLTPAEREVEHATQP